MSDKKPDKKGDDAHGDEAAGGEGEGAKTRKITPLMLMIGGGAFAVILILFVVIYFLFLSGPSAEAPAGEGHGGEAHAAAEEGGHKAEGGKEAGGHEAAGGHGASGGHEAAGGHEAGKEGSAADSPIVELDDMVVNLSTLPGKRASYLKLKVAIEIVRPELHAEMEKQKPRIVDTFQVYLRELRIEDIQGSVGIVRLKEELLARVTQAVAPIEVRDVLFKELLVQ